MLLLSVMQIHASDSVCYGSASNGHLENGVKLPHKGKNFISYSQFAEFLGRTYVHSEVRKIMNDSYHLMESEMPQKVFKYAETGFRNGREFKPHKTHRNGLSVDFMVPVLNEKDESVHLPTTFSNKFGYSIEFDKTGKYKTYQIDFEAMAAHIVSLHKSALNQGHDINRIIFDPQLQPYLFQTQYADYLNQNIRFSKRQAWVRHDEHYHVDFDVPCVSDKSINK